MKVINFKNRYGDEIQSYFTEAVGKKNAPTIVMPHGGLGQEIIGDSIPKFNF